MKTEAGGIYREFMEHRIARITEACTTCGKCFEACPMTVYGDFEGADITEESDEIVVVARQARA